MSPTDDDLRTFAVTSERPLRPSRHVAVAACPDALLDEVR